MQASSSSYTVDVGMEEAVVEQTNAIRERQTKLLHSIIDLYNSIHSNSNDEEAKIVLNRVLTVKGCKLLGAVNGTKTKRTKTLANFLKKGTATLETEHNPSSVINLSIDVLEEDINRIKDKTKQTTYKSELETYNSIYLKQKNIEIDKSIQDMCANFHIRFGDEPSIDITNIKTMISDIVKTPGDNTMIFTMFDPFLKYKIFTAGTTTVENEWMHQFPLKCVIANACLGNEDNLQFRTDETFTRKSNNYLDTALRTCGIETLISEKNHTHVVSSLNDERIGKEPINHVFLILKHQREKCSSCCEHKDLANTLLLMRTCLKSSVHKAQKVGLYIELRTMGVLSSVDTTLLLCMETELLEVENTPGYYGVQYNCSVLSFSNTDDEHRKLVIAHITAHLNSYRKISSESKQYTLLTTPSTFQANQPNTLISYSSFVTDPNPNLFYEPNTSLKGFFKTKGYNYDKRQFLNQDEFTQLTNDYTLLKYETFITEFEVLKSKPTNIMVIATLVEDGLLGFLFEKIKQSLLTLPEGHCSESNNDDQDSRSDMENNGKKRKSENENEEKSKKPKCQQLSSSSTSSTRGNGKYKTYYSENLNNLTHEFDINFKTVTKIKCEFKVGLYFTLKNQFLKIIHYFDKSTENEKGMNIVKSVQHDNISRIQFHEKRILTRSQIRELFHEYDFNGFSEENVIYLTGSDLVVGIDDFNMLFNFQSHSTKMMCFVKLMIDGIEAVNTLHENNIVHSDISILNVGFICNRPNHSKYLKIKSHILEHLHIPGYEDGFNLVLVDLNHCVVEGQEKAQFNRLESNSPYLDNMFFGYTLIPYAPSNETLRFTKQHDVYSMSILLAQFYLIIVHQVSYTQIKFWIQRGSLKHTMIKQLASKEEFNNGSDSTIIKMLKNSIENEGDTDLFNLEQTIKVLLNGCCPFPNSHSTY